MSNYYSGGPVTTSNTLRINNCGEFEHIRLPDIKPYSIQTIQVEKGDTLLIHVSEDLDLDTVNSIFKEVQSIFPDNNILIANEYILKGMTILKPPSVGEVNIFDINNLYDTDTFLDDLINGDFII